MEFPSSAPAREVLQVVWKGEFAPGVIAYGLRESETNLQPVFPFHLWPSEIDVGDWLLHGERWEILMWEIQVDRWPDPRAWKGVVKETLGRLIEAKAVVAWLGSEGGPFADPPDLFMPEHMTGGVLAALTDSGDFLCPLDLDAPLRRLPDSEMLTLRLASRGLAEGE
jgi:hypothetical protein